MTRKIAVPLGRIVANLLRLRRSSGLAARSPIAVVFALHRVLPRDSEWLRPSLVTSVSTFERVVDTVRQLFTPLGLKQLSDFVDGSWRPESDAALFSFDDGYRDVHTYAFPVLNRHELAAALFLTTGFIDGTHRLWWDVLLAAALERAHERFRPFLAKLGAEPAHADGPVVDGLLGALNAAMPRIRSLPSSERRMLLKTVANGNGDIEEAIARKLPPPLTWSQIREWVEWGHCIGSHGVSHCEFASRPADKVGQEIAYSLERIKRETGRRAFALAYPGGITPRLPADHLQRYGIRLAFSTHHGWVRHHDDRYHLRRVNLCEAVLVDESGQYRPELLFAAVGGLFEKGRSLRCKLESFIRPLRWR